MFGGVRNFVHIFFYNLLHEVFQVEHYRWKTMSVSANVAHEYGLVENLHSKLHCRPKIRLFSDLTLMHFSNFCRFFFHFILFLETLKPKHWYFFFSHFDGEKKTTNHCQATRRLTYVRLFSMDRLSIFV